MFTGIVESVGEIVALRPYERGVILEIESNLDLAGDGIGDSFNGVCRTMTARRGSVLEATASAETVKRSTLGAARPGTRVNLERALTLSTRLGGHLVLGHVDTVALVREKTLLGESVRYGFQLDQAFSRFVIEKGSIAVDGVSLTVNEITREAFTVNIIPHTLASTALTLRGVGDRVNLEFDVIGKYVERLLKPGNQDSLENLLKKQGFI